MTKYQRVRVFSFQFKPELQTLPFDAFSLEFPRKWKQLLISLQADTKGRNPEETSIPIKTLNKSLRTLLPDLISISPYAGRESETEWLFSRQIISTQIIWLVVQQWVSLTYAKRDFLPETLKAIQQSDLAWRPRQVNLANWRTTYGGTAEHDEKEVYTLLPDYFASLLSRPNQQFSFGSSGQRILRRAPLAPGGKGAELISWPPFSYQPGKPENESNKDKKPKKPKAFFSVYVKLTLQTIPFASQPFIQLDLGLKRWLGGSTPVQFKNSATAYLSTKVPWAPQLESINSLQPASLHWEKQSDESFKGVWGDFFAQIIGNLNDKFPFADANALISAPETGLSKEDNIAAISYSTRMSNSHSVAAGLMPHDHQMLMLQFAHIFAPYLTLVTPLERQPYKAYRKPNRKQFEFPQTGSKKSKPKPWVKTKSDQKGAKKARPKQAATAEDKKALRTKLASDIGPVIAIELHVQSTTTRQQLSKELSQ